MKQYNGTVTCGVEFITPDDAKKYLEFNGSNRTLSTSKVKQYARDMANGNWVLNGESVCFFENGVLKDGQHRLKAIIQSGKGQWMVVVRGISKDAVVHNRGKLRTVSNVLEIAGYPSGRRNNSEVGAINLLRDTDSTNNEKRLTDTEIMNFIDEYGDYLEAAYRACTKGAERPAMYKASAIAAVFCAVYNGMAIEKIEDFCMIVNSGFCDDEQKFPAVIARNAVLEPLTNSRSGRIRLFRVILAALYDFNLGIARKRAYTVLRQTAWEQKVLNECFQK